MYENRWINHAYTRYAVGGQIFDFSLYNLLVTFNNIVCYDVLNAIAGVQLGSHE